MLKSEVLVVGSGLTGATIARLLTDAGKRVVVLERRSHVGGNVHDHVHPSGIRVHTYGPHYFRTNNHRLWRYVNRFADFFPYEAILKSLVDGRYENWPVAGSYIQRVVGEGWLPSFRGEPRNFEEASLAMMPREIYDRFVRGYTEKQWGVPASALSASLAKRFDVRDDDEPRLMTHKYQGLPRDGYESFMLRMLEGIPVLLNCDYLEYASEFDSETFVVFTGPIDAYFSYDLGRLAYRGQLRSHDYLPDVDYAQPCGQVNNPDPQQGAHIRTIEWKHMMEPEFANRISGTVLTREVTVSPDHEDGFEYPFPDKVNSDLYGRYRQRASDLAGVLICGRLGEYRYYDMDQAIGRASVLAKRVLEALSG